jgi:hypothetical protein
MSDPKKKPGVAFWATVVVVVVLLYLASFGPFVWIEWSTNPPERLHNAAWFLYSPCDWLYSHVEWYQEYINWCGRNGLQRPTHF